MSVSRRETQHSEILYSEDVKRKKEIRNPSGNVKGQILVSLATNSVSLIQGFIITMSSIFLPQVQEGSAYSSEEKLKLTEDQGSWFASIHCGGFIFGSLVGGLQSEYLGRRKSLILDCLIALIGTIIIATANSFELLIFGRFLGGHACASSIISLLAYNGEISHPAIRGMISGVQVLLYYLGTCLMTVLGALLSWRMAIGSSAIFSVITATGIYFSPESPVWLLRYGYKEKARKSLIFLRGSEREADEELQKIESHLKRGNNSKKSNLTLTEKFKGRIESMKCPTFWKPMACLLFLLPIVCQWSGVAFITFYSVTFLSKINVPINPFTAAAFLSLYRLIMCLFSLGGMLKIKRKVVCITTSGLMGLSTFFIALHQFLLIKGYWKYWGLDEYQIIAWLPIVFVLVFYGSLALGFSPAMRSIQGEILPVEKKTFGMGIIGLVEGTSIFIMTKVAPRLMKELKIYGCFILFTCILLLGAIFVYVFIPETKGKSLVEIENYFMKGNKKERERRKSEMFENDA